MNKGCVTIPLGQRGVHVPLARGVRPEVDGSARKNAHQVRTKAFEQSWNTLVDKYVPEQDDNLVTLKYHPKSKQFFVYISFHAIIFIMLLKDKKV